MLENIKNNLDVDPLDVHYALDLDGTRLASFDSLTGGDIEVNVIKHNVVYESGELRTLLIPGPTTFSPITLERGFGNTKELYNWFALASRGKVKDARRNASIILNVFKDGKYSPAVMWNLINAWPTKISGFESNQYNNARLARFSITLMAEAIERSDP